MFLKAAGSAEPCSKPDLVGHQQLCCMYTGNTTGDFPRVDLRRRRADKNLLTWNGRGWGVDFEFVA
jgi:hypothetical protein